MSRAAPPGYASEVEREGRPELSLVVAICAFAATAMATAFYEACIAAPRAYSSLSGAPATGIESALGAGIGVWLHRRARRPLAAPEAFTLLACFCALSAHALAFAFAHGVWLSHSQHAVPLLGGALFGVAVTALGADTARELVQLEALAYVSNPFRLALAVFAWLGLLLLFPPLGILRRAALLAALLGGAAVLLLWLERLFGKQRAPLARRAWLGVGPSAALASLLLAHVRAPLASVQRHPGDVVYTLETRRGEHVLSRSQGGMLLFSDDVLALTSNDATRFAEALVHPALSLAPRRARVLALDDGTGPVPREILRWSDVREVRLLPHDPELARFARENAWFAELGSGALGDARVSVDEREAMPVVLADTSTFDVILLNPSDPSSYRSGKYFTRYWFEALRARLSPHGVLALQATSPLRTPTAHTSIVETLRSAGFSVHTYNAALPTLGEWGFALAFSDSKPLAERLALAAPLPQGTHYVSTHTLDWLLQGAAEPSAPADAQVNHLWDQALVETYRHEDQSVSD